MSNNTQEQSNAQAVPFFARFLESQGSEAVEGPETRKYPSDSEEVTTHKYPSDEEDGY
ncbi:MAG: microviridin/marinostatin family tricyclic proteinase inhibitor [Symploca sp. SIO2E6]|nr:microviridin/marinostatin family tricyclic proteinase inhibitor [Symploca sp. SIO2E6]